MSKLRETKRRMWFCLFAGIVLLVLCVPLTVGVITKLAYVTAPVNDPILGSLGTRLQYNLERVTQDSPVIESMVKYSPSPVIEKIWSWGNFLCVLVVAGFISGIFFVVLFFRYLDRILDIKRRSDDQQMVIEQKELNQNKKISSASRNKRYDLFISHSSEDKDDFARPLAHLLGQKGLQVWYDEATLRLGDSLRRSIDKGLSQSRYGVVVLSDSFFSKAWPQYELDGLVSKELENGKTILPLWHKVTKEQVMAYSPPIADRVAINTSLMTLDEIANKIVEVVSSGEA